MSDKEIINILVVDDEEVVLNFFKRLFKDALYEVTALKTGQEALAAALKRGFDIAFVDIGLRDMSGVELCQKLKGIGPDIHVMLITGDPGRNDGKGQPGCLYKPFELDKLYLEIDKIRLHKKAP